MCLPAHEARPANPLPNNQTAAGMGTEVLPEAYGGPYAPTQFGYRSVPNRCSAKVTGMSVLDQDSVNYACILRRMAAPMLKIPGELL